MTDDDRDMYECVGALIQACEEHNARVSRSKRRASTFVVQRNKTVDSPYGIPLCSAQTGKRDDRVKG